MNPRYRKYIYESQHGIGLQPGAWKSPPPAKAAPRNRHGFTIIEILMVVSIMVILVGLLVGGGSAAISYSRKNQTKATLAVLDSISAEYYLRKNQYFTSATMTNSSPPFPYSTSALLTSSVNTTMNQFITAAIPVVGTPTGTAAAPGDIDIPAKLGSALVLDTFGNYHVYDAWGHDIFAYNPNSGTSTSLRPWFWSFGPNGVDDSGGTGGQPWQAGATYGPGNTTIVGYNLSVWSYSAAAAAIGTVTKTTNNAPGAADPTTGLQSWTQTDDIRSAGGSQ